MRPHSLYLSWNFTLSGYAIDHQVLFEKAEFESCRSGPPSVGSGGSMSSSMWELNWMDCSRCCRKTHGGVGSAQEATNSRAVPFTPEPLPTLRWLVPPRLPQSFHFHGLMKPIPKAAGEADSQRLTVFGRQTLRCLRLQESRAAGSQANSQAAAQ